MPNEPLVNYSNPSELAAYLGELQQAGAHDAESDVDIPPNKLVPQLRMSKDSDMLTVKLDDQQIDAAKSYYVAVLLERGSRALFAPQGEAYKEWKQPVCASGLAEPVAFVEESVQGSWLVNEDFPQPMGSYRKLPDGQKELIEVPLKSYAVLECCRCPHNQFGSEGAWDSSKADSRGKACKEARHFFVRIMQKRPGVDAIVMPVTKEELYIFEEHPSFKDFVRMPLGLGSNRKVIQQLLLAVKARSLPLSSAVFKFSVKIEQPSPGVKYPVLVWEFVGVPTREAKQAQAASVEKALAFVERNKRKLGSEEEVPF